MAPPRDPEALQDETSVKTSQKEAADANATSTAAAATNTTNTAAISKLSLLSQSEHPHYQQSKEQFLQDFCKFLQFETVSSLAPETGAYKDCAAWLMQYIKTNLPWLHVLYLPEAPEHSPVVVALWKGLDETLPVLLLNSHYDVVPADPAAWTVPPFDGLRREGRMYGRGAQDMKCVCLQYLQALQCIHAMDATWQPARNLYLTFVPDEEVGGSGMAAFLDSQLYKTLPAGIALALDEGLASTTDVFQVFYGERLPWWVNVTATGPTGHGSRFIDHTAVEQILELSRKALQFRQGQRQQLGLDDHSNCAHAVAAKNSNNNNSSKNNKNAGNDDDDDNNNNQKSHTKSLGDVTSLNITTLQAGVRVGDTFAYNCVPPTASCSLDIRISPHMPPSQMKSLLDEWCHECSADATQGFELKWNYIGGQNGSSDNDLQQHAITSTDAKQNPWYACFAQSLADQGYEMEPQVFPAATDSRFLRALGIRALGFSPMRNTEIMLHENDEYIPEETYLEGINVYVGLLKALASQGAEMEEQKERKQRLQN